MKGVVAKEALFRQYWLPVLIWMSVIYLFSNQPYSGEISRAYFGAWNIPVRKGAHVFEYFVLTLLAHRALQKSADCLAGHCRLFAFALSAFYAASDEWHQSFVPGRSASTNDALVDMIGALLALLLLALKARFTYRKR